MPHNEIGQKLILATNCRNRDWLAAVINPYDGELKIGWPAELVVNARAEFPAVGDWKLVWLSAL